MKKEKNVSNTLMKALGKILEILAILLVQIIVGWLVTKFLLKLDWDVVEFVTDPGMIAFWSAYVIIELAIGCLRRYRKNSSYKT